MTNVLKCGIINKFAAKTDGSHRAGWEHKNHGSVREKDLKKSEKPLDKRKKMWYNRKACKLIERYRKRADLKNHASKKTSKKFEKKA